MRRSEMGNTQSSSSIVFLFITHNRGPQNRTNYQWNLVKWFQNRKSTITNLQCTPTSNDFFDFILTHIREFSLDSGDDIYILLYAYEHWLKVKQGVAFFPRRRKYLLPYNPILNV